MRRRAQVDGNQAEIVEALRSIPGCTVEPLHRLGQGVPDLLVGWRGLNLLLEVKDDAQQPNKRALTEEEARWHRKWRGQVVVVENVREALAVIQAVSEANPSRNGTRS